MSRRDLRERSHDGTQQRSGPSAYRLTSSGPPHVWLYTMKRRGW